MSVYDLSGICVPGLVATSSAVSEISWLVRGFWLLFIINTGNIPHASLANPSRTRHAASSSFPTAPPSLWLKLNHRIYKGSLLVEKRNHGNHLKRCFTKNNVKLQKKLFGVGSGTWLNLSNPCLRERLGPMGILCPCVPSFIVICLVVAMISWSGSGWVLAFK